MAPSKETSCEAHLPVEVAPKILALAQHLQSLSLQDSTSNGSAADQSNITDDVAIVTGAEHHIEHCDKNEGAVTNDAAVVAGVKCGDENGNARATDAPASTGLAPNTANMVKNIINNLAGGPLAYLISSTPASSTSDAPLSAAQPIPPLVIFMKNFVPTTVIEATLLSHIQDSEG